jgi:hypothetical protein
MNTNVPLGLYGTEVTEQSAGVRVHVGAESSAVVCAKLLEDARELAATFFSTPRRKCVTVRVVKREMCAGESQHVGDEYAAQLCGR